MAYKDLNDLVLETNYKAKDLDIINFNYAMSSIKLYVNQLNENIKTTVLDMELALSEIGGFTKVVYNDSDLEDVKEGEMYFKAV